MPNLTQTDRDILITGEQYRVEYDAARPYFLRINSAGGDTGVDLFVPSGFHPLGGRDVTTSISPPSVRRGPDSLVLEFLVGSNVWSAKKCLFRCDDLGVDYHVELDGKGLMDDGSFFQGFSATPIAKEGFPRVDYRSKAPVNVDGNHPQASLPGFDVVFNPQPNHDMRQHFWFGEYSVVLGCSDRSFLGDAFHGGCWQLVPPPLCYSVSGGSSGEWMTMGLGVPAGQYNFTAYEYNGGSTFGLNLAYEGHTRVDGKWESPRVMFAFADGDYAAQARYVKLLEERGYVEFPRREQADWWKRPIVCGWGHECYFRCHLSTVPPPHYCTQANYEDIVRTLNGHGLSYGTLVVDDKWQGYYGDPRPDPGKWPDMRGFIEMQHAKGVRVLLWLKSWDCEGVPVEECVTDEDGKAVTVDPSNPAYEKRLRAAVRKMLSEDEGCLNADGFKLDATSNTPTGKKLKAHGEIWGIELLKKLYTIIHDEAKKAKPDALIMAHSPNPYFADIIDVLRLNDIHHADEQIVKRMTHRAKIAKIACPDWLIDTDNWPIPNRKTWLAYMREQPKLGIPSLYYADHIDISGEEITEEDYEEIRQIWAAYEEKLSR